ncbi:hypothetical protein [Actinosynnema sp. NPDC020468]|uniref:hypothetical protein n=1 Tax=Actinosynnema sp. NPDC020468 TaxID=3154488 RepID=UPI00340FDE5E
MTDEGHVEVGGDGLLSEAIEHRVLLVARGHPGLAVGADEDVTVGQLFRPITPTWPHVAGRRVDDDDDDVSALAGGDANEVPARAGRAGETGDEPGQLHRLERGDAGDCAVSDAENHQGTALEVTGSGVGVPVGRAENELHDLGPSRRRGEVDVGLHLQEVPFDAVVRHSERFDQRRPFDLSAWQYREVHDHRQS